MAAAPAGARSERRTFRSRSGASGGRRLMPAGYVLLVILIGLALAALLNARTLANAAKDQPVGLKRDVLVALTKPITGISSLLRLDKPRELVDAALGRSSQEQSDVHHRPNSGGHHTATPTPGASGSASATPRPAWTPSKHDKLALWVGGDSMAMVFGQSLVAMSQQTRVIDAVLDYHVSSGLSRPDFFDWPKRLRAEMTSYDPDVAVALFGANDAQGVEYQGKVLKFDTPEWIALYHERVGAAMDILIGKQHRPVWWVGMPISRLSDYNYNLMVLNKVYGDEARKRPEVRYVDSWTMFADKNGNYTDYLRGLSGTTELMRQSDGIHWTRAGGDLLAKAVLDQVEAHWHIE